MRGAERVWEGIGGVVVGAMESIDDGVDELPTAPEGYQYFLKSDFAKLDDALRAAAEFMYSDLNETRTASIPERLFVNVGTLTVYLAASEVISMDAALAVLDVMEASHRQLIEECPTVTERNQLYYTAIIRDEVLRMAEEKQENYFKVQKTPEKPPPLEKMDVISTGMPATTRSGRRKKQGITKRGDIVGARHRKKFRSVQKLNTNLRVRAKLKQEMHGHYNALLKQKAKDAVPGLLITIGHCAAIAAGAPVAVAAAAATVAHGIDMWRRGLFDDLSLRGLASGTARGVTTAVTSVGQVVLSNRRRRAAAVPITSGTQRMLTRSVAVARRSLGVGTAYQTAGAAADEFAASEIGSYMTAPVEWIIDNPVVTGVGAVAMGSLVVAYEFGTREAHYEPLRLEHWFKLNDEKDAKNWRDSLNDSMESIAQEQKHPRKKVIQGGLKGAMNVRLRAELDDAEQIKRINRFIDDMHGLEGEIRDLLDTTHPAVFMTHNVYGDIQEYDATGFIRPRPPMLGAVAGGAAPALPPPPGPPPPPPGGGDDDDGDDDDGDDGAGVGVGRRNNPWALPALQAINRVNMAHGQAPAPAPRRRRARS